MSATCSHFSVLRQGKTTLTLRITNKQGGVISKGRPDLCTTQCPLFTGGVRGSGFNAVQFWLVFRITSIVTSSHLDVQLWNAREHWSQEILQPSWFRTSFPLNFFWVSFSFEPKTHTLTLEYGFSCWGVAGWVCKSGLGGARWVKPHHLLNNS